ncbi:SusC/RagA family TonB-linked outer membrane protein, partial [Parabacteroides goldsteinii]
MKKISTERNAISFLNINSFRKMKLILLFIGFCFFQLYAINGYAQNTKISLELTHVKLSEAIKVIEEKTPFVFFLNNSEIDMNRQVSLNLKEASIKEVLNQLLAPGSYRIENYKIVLLADKMPQEGKITGKVIDETGMPVIGANVIDKKTNNGTITDLNGQFILDAPQDATLTVSFIGYISQDIHLKGQKDITVTLKEDTQLLDEVVVVGFGTQKKVNLTGAVASVNLSETLGDRPVPNIAQALQGTTPGLQIGSETGTPGDAMSYNIRGTTSINGGTPLVLVNNVPMDINMIDPQEIESVSILKDAASAAIYGARAAFGVILITTKQGKKDSAPKFNYNNNISFSKPLELPQKANPLESVLAYKEMGWPNDTYVDGKNITQWEGYIRDYQSNPGKYPNGYIFDENGNLFLMKERNMFDDMTDNFGFMQNHSMSVSGGSEKTVYRIGVGYTGEDGILITDKDSYDRLNLSTFMGVDVNSWLTTQLDLKYGNSKQKKVEAGGRNTVWVAAMNLPSYQNN